MPRVKNKSFGWAANRNQLQYRLKFVVTITQYFAQKKQTKPKNSLDQKLTPQNSNSHKTSLVVLHSQNVSAGILRHYHESSDCF